MSRLFIAEKPSLGRAIAFALPKPHKNQQGFIECGNGDVVTWCIGHLLEQVMPEEYDERYKSWSMDTSYRAADMEAQAAQNRLKTAYRC